MTSPHNDPIAPHLAVMENLRVECVVCKGAGQILHMWDRPGGSPGNGYAPCPACNGGLVDDGRAQALKDFAKAMNEFPSAHLLPTAASEQSTTLDQRRARAQAQPRGEGGRFSSGDPVRHLRESEVQEIVRRLTAAWRGKAERLEADIAERDAELERLRGVIRTAHTFNRNVCESWGKCRAAHKWFLVAGLLSGLILGRLI